MTSTPAGVGSALTRTVIEQGQKPSGRLGWVVTAIMTVRFVPINARMARLAQIGPDDSVLDVACGTGEFLRRHGVRAATVAGIDHSHVQVTAARRLLRQRIAKGSADVRQGDATTLPWSDGTFSVVTCNCLDCFGADRPQSALNEMHRVLRPGGRVVIGVDKHDDPVEARQTEQRTGLNAFTGPDLTALLDEAGFSEIDTSLTCGSLRFARATVPSDTPLPTTHSRRTETKADAGGHRDGRARRGVLPARLPRAHARRA